MIKSKSTTTVRGQEKVDRLRRELARHPKAYVTIGVHEQAGQYPPDKDGNPGPLVAEVALWMEWGTSTAPARPFLGWVMDEKREQINRFREEAINKIATGEFTVAKALESMGFKIMTLVQNRIKSNPPPPNAPSTAEGKRRAGIPVRTLQSSKLLLRSITYQVHLG